MIERLLDLPLYRIESPTPFPVGPVNIYLITEPEPVLIDTGLGTLETLECLERRLTEIGLRIERLKKIVVTHGHQDHYGLAGTLAERSGAPIYAPARDELHFTHSAELNAFYDIMLEQAGVPRPQIACMAEQLAELRTLGEPIAKYCPLEELPELTCGPAAFRTVATPGHTPGSVCFFERERRLLLSSDTVLKDITPNPVLDRDPSSPNGRFRSLARFLESLDCLARLDPAIAYTAHGQPVENFGEVHERCRHHHEKRRETVLACLRDRGKSVYEIGVCLFPDERRYNSFLAVSEVYAHVDWLVEAGRVTARFDGGVAVYSAAQSGWNSPRVKKSRD